MNVVSSFHFFELKVGIVVDVDLEQAFGNLLGHVVGRIGSLHNHQRTLDTSSKGFNLENKPKTLLVKYMEDLNNGHSGIQIIKLICVNYLGKICITDKK